MPPLTYHVRRERHAGPLVADETVYWSGQLLPLHVHARAIVFVLLEGHAIHGYGNHAHAVAPGMVVFVPAGTPHSMAFSGSVTRVHSLEIDVDQSACALPNTVIHSSRPQLVGLMMRSYRMLTDDFGDFASIVGELARELAVVHATRQTVITLQERGSWLPKVFEFISSGRSKSVRLSLIAKAVGRNPAHVSRRFHEAFGESMINARKHARIAAAGRALLDRDTTVSEIAAELGFSDHAHLTRSFRRAIRMSPTEFRGLVEDTGLPDGARLDPRHAGIAEFVAPLSQVHPVSA